jgi:predicted ester cyclase
VRGPENIKAMIRGIHPSTGNSVEYTGIDIIRIANGRIVELWNQMDVVGFNRQMQK